MPLARPPPPHTHTRTHAHIPPPPWRPQELGFQYGGAFHNFLFKPGCGDESNRKIGSRIHTGLLNWLVRFAPACLILLVLCCVVLRVTGLCYVLYVCVLMCVVV